MPSLTEVLWKLIIATAFGILLNAPGRLNAQNIPDPAFGVGGLLTYGQQNNLSEETVTCSTYDPFTGQILVAGSFTNDGITRPFIARYASNGSRVPDGTYYINSTNTTINAIAVNSTGDIVVVGHQNNIDQDPWLGSLTSGSFAIVDYNYSINFPSTNTSLTSVHFTSMGNIVAAGTNSVAAIPQAMVMKLDASFTYLSHIQLSELSTNKSTASALNGDTLFMAGYIDATLRDTMIARKFTIEPSNSITQDNAYQFKYTPPTDGLAEPGGITVLPGGKTVIVATIGASTAIGLFRINHDGNLDPTSSGSAQAIGWGDGLHATDVRYNTTYDRLFLTGTYMSGGLTNGFGMAYSTDGFSNFAQTFVDINPGSTETPTEILTDGTSFYYVGSLQTTNSDIFIAKADQSLTLDGSYGISGAVVDYLISSAESLFDTQITPDGGVVVLVKSSSGSSDKTGLLKFDATGALENSFGTNGYAEWSDITPDDELTDLALTASGSILVAGTTAVDALHKQLVLAKYNPDGTPVGTFGGGSTGYITYNYKDSISNILDVMEMPDGKIVLAARYDSSDGNKYVLLMRLTASGTIDNTFNSDGVLATSIQLRDWGKTNLLIDINLSSVLCITTGGGSGARRIVAFRVSTSGALDTGFGNAGYFTSSLGGMEELQTGADIDAAGNIYIAGIKMQSVNYNMAVVKLRNNGQPDPGFGTTGAIQPSLSNAAFALDIEVLDNSLYITGSENSSLVIIKTDLAGALDIGFDLDGSLTLHAISTQEGFSASASTGVLYIGNNLIADNEDIQLTRFIYSSTSTLLSPGITMADINKVYGDAPFTALANSASPAPITYSVVNGCLTVDGNGNFVITCAGTATIRASQQALAPYDADFVDATVSIAKATPFLTFNNQGAVVGDAAFDLTYTSNSDGTPFFSTSTNSIFNLTAGGNITPLSDGSNLITLVIPATTNYLAISASATFTVYLTPVPPEVTQMVINASLGDTIRFAMSEILIGKSSPIDLSSIDLDPSTPGVQTTYASPSMGFFSVDNGILTFIPIYGFTGEASLNFEVSDVRGETSEVSNLRFVYTLPNNEAIPPLVTKEIFTPNGDGFNDAFVIAFLDNTLTNTFVVYDRNGHEVYKVSDYQNSWEGQDDNGKKLDNGIYYYQFSDELNRVVKGAVVIKH